MSAPAIPSVDQLRRHEGKDHKYRAGWKGDRVLCLTCRSESHVASDRKRRRATPRPLPSPAGFVTHQNGTTVTHAITPGVGMSLGQLAALVDLAFRGGHSSTDRVQVRVNPRKRGGDRFGHRIEGICITPGPSETGEVAS